MLDEERLIQNLPLGRSSLWKEGALRFYSVSDLQKAATNELDVFIITLSSRTHSSVSHCPVSAAYAPPPPHTHVYIHRNTLHLTFPLLTALFLEQIVSTLKSPTYFISLASWCREGVDL